MTSNQLIPQDKLTRYLRTPHIIPHDLQKHKQLLHTIHASLPSNYNFELVKTIWRIIVSNAHTVGLQMPDGLLVYACIIADILTRYTQCDIVILSDTVYGACCVDDISAKALNVDLLVHYGHSCLVSNNDTLCNALYIFVTIDIDTQHFIDTVKYNFPLTNDSSDDSKLYDTDSNTKHIQKYDITFGGTIQFTNSLQRALPALQSYYGSNNVHLPQCNPLSQGETLGCTSSQIKVKDTIDTDTLQVLVFVADGRFHLESLMIQNPHIQHIYKYDPYNKKLTYEQYGHSEMYTLRQHAIDVAQRSLYNNNNAKVGIILGTLGRQGSTHLLHRIQPLCTQQNIQYITVLLSEIMPAKLQAMPDIACWIQIACPRLSIDWGHAFNKPLLNTYEAEIVLHTTQWQSVYPMDYYSNKGGNWTNYAHKQSSNKHNKVHKNISVEYEYDTAIDVR